MLLCTANKAYLKQTVTNSYLVSEVMQNIFLCKIFLIVLVLWCLTPKKESLVKLCKKFELWNAYLITNTYYEGGMFILQQDRFDKIDLTRSGCRGTKLMVLFNLYKIKTNPTNIVSLYGCFHDKF